MKKLLNLWGLSMIDIQFNKSSSSTFPQVFIAVAVYGVFTITGESQYKETNPFEGFDEYSFFGWDGEDAIPIREQTLTGAKNLISKLPRNFRHPDAAPGIDGSVCMEWLIGEAEIFIDFNSDGSILVFADINGEKYKDGFSRFDNTAFEYILSIFQEELTCPVNRRKQIIRAR